MIIIKTEVNLDAHQLAEQFLNNSCWDQAEFFNAIGRDMEKDNWNYGCAHDEIFSIAETLKECGEYGVEYIKKLYECLDKIGAL
jgi:hypothetical protein